MKINENPRLKQKGDEIIFKLSQGQIADISGSPWVYWIKPKFRSLFRELPGLGNITRPGVGQNTGDNARFLRFWWEVGKLWIHFNCTDFETAIEYHQKWFPYMKGGSFLRWYGNQERVVNWQNDAEDMKAYAVMRNNGKHWSRYLQNLNLCFREGITWSDLGTRGFAVRYLPPGFIFDVKGSSGFPEKSNLLLAIAIMNSTWMNYALGLLNPTVSFQVGDISRVPYKQPSSTKQLKLEGLVLSCIRSRQLEAYHSEITFEYISPILWGKRLEDLHNNHSLLENLENQIDGEIFANYEIIGEDREAIDAEFAYDVSNNEINFETNEDDFIEETLFTLQELAIQWISFAVGIALGRFQSGIPGALGSAIYSRSDFAIGSLPEPSEELFDQLVGPPNQFAYFDPQGGRHVFSEKVEKDLQALALPDGIAILDEGHERDLATRVGKALEWMLGEQGAQEVIQQGAGGDLRSFLNKDYFTQYHLRWYRKRPVYWYIQSAKRSFGFVLFHEKIDKNTFYTLQHEVANKRKAIQFQLEDLQKALLKVQGSQRKQVEKNNFELHQLDEEQSEFAQALEAITSGGYEPEPSWIDDGVILRMAPIWTVIPLWKSEPKKYWERLEKGDFDWSRIAMKYWPERVRDKCRTNKSFAIAHDHVEWYEGD